jgi:glycosyltransferase involved in cell wall biosynthesis
MNVVLILSEGYPNNFSANNSKAEFIALGLLANGSSVTMIDSPFGTKGVEAIVENTSNKGIHYYLLPRKGKYSAFFRNIYSISKLLKKERKKGGNFIIVGMYFYPVMPIICFISMRLKYKRTALFHEWHIGCQQPNLTFKIEAWIRDKTFGYLLNGIFPISSFLEKKSTRFKKKTLRLPVLADFPDIKMIEEDLSQNYFVYCANAGFLRIVEFVINAYSIAQRKGLTQKLILVLYGRDSQINNIQNLINNADLTTKIQIRTKLSNTDLLNLYRNALGLLIPLDPDSLQDVARFSQKIAEYVASGRPIITSNTGEIPYYFENNKSAKIVAFTEPEYANAMLELSTNPSLANKIGEEGRLIGKTYFDYTKNGKNILNFFEKL